MTLSDGQLLNDRVSVWDGLEFEDVGHQSPIRLSGRSPRYGHTGVADWLDTCDGGGRGEALGQGQNGVTLSGVVGAEICGQNPTNAKLKMKK